MSTIGPKGHWFWGNTKQFASSTLGFVEHCMLNYKDLCYARIGFKDFYLPLNAELADYVLRVNNKNYKKSFAYSGLKVFLGKGLLTNEGQEWLTQRRLMQPNFNKEAIVKMQEIMLSTTQEIIDTWKGKISLNKEINNITRSIIAKSIFGDSLKNHPSLELLPDILATFRKYGNDKMKNPLKLPLWLPSKENTLFKTHFGNFKTIIFDGIKERRKNPMAHHDILALFVHLKDEEGNQMSDSQIYDEIATLFIAGQETTTNALLFALFCLDKNKNVQEKLKIELDQKASAYLKNICMETLRLLPPAWAISREAINDDVLGNVKIKKGDTVFIPLYAFHRNEAVWENAKEFIPERFEGDYPKKWYMPFGDGPRFCIGNHFAMMEMELVLKLIYQQKNLHVVSPKALTFTTLMTLSPKEEIFVEVE
jgi:cytochrome P450